MKRNRVRIRANEQLSGLWAIVVDDGPRLAECVTLFYDFATKREAEAYAKRVRAALRGKP